MPLPKTTLLAALTVLYFGPGLLFFYVANGADEPSSSAVLTSPGEAGEPLHVTGTVYCPDGPAAGVDLYVFHTDASGRWCSTSSCGSRPTPGGCLGGFPWIFTPKYILERRMEVSGHPCPLAPGRRRSGSVPEPVLLQQFEHLTRDRRRAEDVDLAGQLLEPLAAGGELLR